jgi:hypothetical protein
MLGARLGVVGILAREDVKILATLITPTTNTILKPKS